MKHLFSIFLFLIIPSWISACIINQLIGDTNNGVNWPEEGPTWGQSFVPCENGEVWEIAFWPHSATTGIHTLILTDINCVTMWTVNNIDLSLSGGNPVVVDLSTGSGTNRSVSAGSSYIFQLIGPAGSILQTWLTFSQPYTAGEDIAANCASYGLDWWFRVGINEPLGSLPVELSSFDADINEKGTAIVLSFETASEIGASYFEIEHSTSGIDYQKIGKVQAVGNALNFNGYQFIHRLPNIGLNYYRLKQVDEDGYFEYSKVIAIQFESRSINFKISPNPANDKIVVYFNRNATHNWTLNMYDISGQLMKYSSVENGAKSFIWGLDDISPGIYLISILKEGIPLAVKKVVKQ